MINISSRMTPSNFSGLWLDDPDRLGDPEYRSALLFLVGPDQDYIVRFNHAVITEQDRSDFSDQETKVMEETNDDVGTWDYVTTSNAIIQHPRGMEEEIQLEVPWRIEADGTLALRTSAEEKWEYFRPAAFDDLYQAGFSRRFMREVLEEIKDKGWRYQLVCAVPSPAAA